MARPSEPQENEDQIMVDAPPVDSDATSDADVDQSVEYTLRTLQGSTKDAASYEFTNEDHTLGNALRHLISKNPDVEFCGYTIPHPAEPKMHLRIQTYDGVEAEKVLEKGLDDLITLCDIVLDKFEKAAEDFENNRDSAEDSS